MMREKLAQGRAMEPDIFQVVEKNRVADFIDRLTPLVKEFCRSGIAIAREFAKAEAVLPPKQFGELCRHFHLSYSTGRKRANVGNSERIKEHEDKLRSIDAWSTLHAITTLNDEEFERFKAEHLSGDAPVSLMRADVERFKSGTCAKRSGFSVVAVVELDVSRIELEDVFKVEEELDDLSKRLSQFPAVHVAMKGLAERLAVKLQAENNKATKQEQEQAVKAARKRLREVIASKIARMPGPNRKAQWLKRTRYSWNEELFDPQLNPNIVLMEEFGEEPVEPQLVDAYFAKYEDPSIRQARREPLDPKIPPGVGSL
jgi:hypothetical protein